MNKKFLAVTMASVISLNIFPFNIFKKTTHAAGFVSNISKIENPVAGGVNGNWSGNYIYFGHYPQSLTPGAASSSPSIYDYENDPIKWRVLDNNNTVWNDSKSIEENGFAYNIGYGDNKGGRQNAPVGGNGILLYSDIALDSREYHSSSSPSLINTLKWTQSDLYNVLQNSFFDSITTFFYPEQCAIMDTKVYSEDLNSSRGLSGSERTSLSQDKLFIPSYNEMLNTSYGFTDSIYPSNTRSRNNTSWLRSPGINTDYVVAASLDSDGLFLYVDVYCTMGVCPAFNLNPASVIFASEAAASGSSDDEVVASDTEGGGKKSMEVSSMPAKFELPTGTGNEYKLTLHDESRDNFVAEKTSQNGNEITISYSNAKTGENEYISCMILDDDSEIKYYGKLKEVDSESGEATLTLPEEFKIGDKVNVAIINEQCHEGNETDWSNWPNVFEVTVEKAAEPSPEPSETPSDDKSSDESENDFDFSFSYFEPSENSQKTEVNESESKIIFTAYSDKESVEIFNRDTKEVKYEDKVANITPKLSDNILEIEIKDENGNELNVGGKIILIAPQDICKPGTVAVTSNGKVVRKSIAKDGKLYLPLESSETYKIFDNKKIFFDVLNHWANDAIDFASGHELFNGTASNIFEPETPMSRAMMVQVLHNLEDNQKQTFEKFFGDVNIDNWFAEAVTWATKNNLMSGYDKDKFAPNDNITREQLATILYRYFGKNEIVDINLDFENADQITDYALNAMKWAVKYGIVQGKDNNVLDPNDSATRAEVAQMFQNLMLKLFY